MLYVVGVTTFLIIFGHFNNFLCIECLQSVIVYLVDGCKPQLGLSWTNTGNNSFLVIFGVYNVLQVVTDIFYCFLSIIVFLLHRLSSKNLM